MGAKRSSASSYVRPSAWLVALAAVGIGVGALWPDTPVTGTRDSSHREGKSTPYEGVERVREVTSETRRSPRTPSPSRTVEETLRGVVQTIEGLPIAAATVCVTPVKGTRACTLTDRSGRFGFEARPRGAGVLSASAPDFLPAERRLDDAPSAEPVDVVLHAGGARVTGSVVDASGGPVGAALLTATQPALASPVVAFSDAAGLFTLTVLPGDVHVTALADGYSTGEAVATAPQRDLTLTVTGAASLSGRVLFDESLTPAPGAEVTVHNQNGLRLLARTTQTDAQGAFEIDGLAMGNYVVSALSEAGRASEQWFTLEIGEEKSLDIRLSPATVLRGRVRVGDDPCDVGSVDLDGPVADSRPLQPGGQVEFRGLLPGPYRAHVHCLSAVAVDEELLVGREPIEQVWTLTSGLSVRGSASSAGGGPLPGARLDINPFGAPLERNGTSCVADAAGRFECSGLLPGEYDCRLSGDGSAASDVVRLRLDAHDAEVELRASPSASFRVEVEGDSLRDLSVLAWRAGEQPVTARLSSGEFFLEQLPLGDYEVAVDPSPPGTHQRAALTQDGQVVRLRFSGIQTDAIAGRVVDERGEGVPDAWVRAMGTSEQALFRAPRAVLTDGAGLFRVAGLPRGSYHLLASSSAGEARVDDVRSQAGAITLTLQTFGSLSGRVTTEANVPVSDFVVEYSKAETDAIDRVAGRAGSWAVPWLAPGSYAVAVTAREGSARSTVEVVAGTETTLALTLAGARGDEGATAARD